MSTFLAKTAQHLVSTYGDNFSDCCIVLPNKRAGLFLKQELSKLIKKPIWLPPILGAEDLIEKLSNTEIIDNLTQLFELYEVYQKLISNPESFEEFSKWGQILLHDFNEIDRYLIPVDTFFKTINDVRAIEVWNLGEHELSTIQLNYLAFWKQMGKLYEGFQQHLTSQNKSYQGKAFRVVAEKLKSNPTSYIEDNIKWHKVIFIGFNALTLAEETIITILKQHHKADVLWDADEYYLNDVAQESGLFLRAFKQKQLFTPFNWISNKFATEKKQIHIIGIPQNIGQANYLSTLFNSINGENHYKDTAVVLADENLLIPVLESLPPEVSNINVTMGYPIKNSPLSNFFEIYLNMLLNANRFGKGVNLSYHYKDFLKLLQLPFSQIIFGKEACKYVINNIIKHNWVFINKEKLDDINAHFPFKFDTNYSFQQTVEQCLLSIELGKNYLSSNPNQTSNTTLELEYLFHFSKLFNQINLLNTEHQVIDSIKTLVIIYRQLLSTIAVDLYGEPLQGLQVMGMLETRNIDFKNVILLSTNEGVLPAGKTFNSFVPFDIKKAFNLPTHIEKDAVYAYHFYRLVQNAENMYIVYNTETNEFGSGEKSRFVTQIENELEGMNNITIHHKIITYPTPAGIEEITRIEKSALVLKKIEAFFDEGVSPTAISAYMSCPLDFYYKYILKIREVDEVEENIESNTFGTVVHNVLEKLYAPLMNSKLELAECDIKNMFQLVPELVETEFIEQGFRKKELKTGKNFISFTMANNYITSFLTNEIQFLTTGKPTLLIKQLEEKLSHQLSTSTITAKLKGKVDRVDANGNVIRILDYKTGRVESSELTISCINDIVEKNKSKAFQVLFYAYLYAKQNHVDNLNVTSGIIALRKQKDVVLPLKIAKDQNITPVILEEFEQLMIKILEDIKNPELPFEHKKDAKYCLYC